MSYVKTFSPVVITGKMVSLTKINLYSSNFKIIKENLLEKIGQNSSLLKSIPVIISIDIETDITFLSRLIELLRTLNLKPIAIAGKSEVLEEFSNLTGLAYFKKSDVEQKALSTEKNSTPARKKDLKIHRGIVRSGQQIYAESSDLVLIGNVNPGAEIIADGNIYIFGEVQGKIFAGARGEMTAKIIATQLDAELISIAGMFKLAKESNLKYNDSVEIFLVESKMIIQKI